MMIINGKDALSLKKYDYNVLKKIYDQGTKQIMLDKDSLSDTELALITSAGHALDLVDSLKSESAKKIKCKLDFQIETQVNIGNAVLVMFISKLQKGTDEREIRNDVAKKVSSYLLFEMWNFFNLDSEGVEIEFDLAMGFDLLQGCRTMSKQGIRLINSEDRTNTHYFDALSIGRDFSKEDVHILDPKNNLIGIDMPSFSERIQDVLVGFV